MEDAVPLRDAAQLTVLLGDGNSGASRRGAHYGGHSPRGVAALAGPGDAGPPIDLMLVHAVMGGVAQPTMIYTVARKDSVEKLP